MKQDSVAIMGLRTIADRFDHVLLDQWGTLSNLFGFLPVIPRLTRLSDTAPRAIAQSSNIFHPPRTNRSINV